MQVLEAAVAVNPWPLRRERAAELAERYPHAAEMLRLYQALTVAQEEGSFPPPLAGEGQGGGKLPSSAPKGAPHRPRERGRE